jgi:hypothetical protein
MHTLRSTPTVPIAVAALTVLSLALGYSLAITGESDAVGFAVASAVAICATAVVFGPVRARTADDEARGRRTAWWLAGLSVLTLPVFWLGIPAVLGAGAFLTGRETRTTPAMLIGALTFLLALGSAIFA